MPNPRWIRPLVAFLVVAAGLLPLGLYWGILGSVPTLTAQEAIETLSGTDGSTVLIDARDAPSFDARHVQAAQHWSLEEIAALSSRDQVPAQFQGKTLLLICNTGVLSATAVRKLQALGLDRVYNVRGGMQAWVAAWKGPCATPLCRFEASSGQVEDLPLRELPRYQQLAEGFAGFVLKPTHITLSLLLAILLIVTRRDAPDLVALRWALFSFAAGEISCFVNTLSNLLLDKESYLFDYLHGLGMATAFGLTAYALIEGLDKRVFKLSSPGERCAALDLCGPCIKYEDAPCGARRLFLLVTPLCVLLAAAPLFSTIDTVAYGAHIAGIPYSYTHLAIHQVFEIRYCPLLAIGLFGASFVVLWFRNDRPAPVLAKVLFSAGFGAFAYSMFRILFSSIYRDDLVWFEYWEEFTELLYVVAIGAVLWIFRSNLFPASVLQVPTSILDTLLGRGDDTANP